MGQTVTENDGFGRVCETAVKPSSFLLRRNRRNHVISRLKPPETIAQPSPQPSPKPPQPSPFIRGRLVAVAVSPRPARLKRVRPSMLEINRVVEIGYVYRCPQQHLAQRIEDTRHAPVAAVEHMLVLIGDQAASGAACTSAPLISRKRHRRKRACARSSTPKCFSERARANAPAGSPARPSPNSGSILIRDRIGSKSRAARDGPGTARIWVADVSTCL